MDIFDVFDLDSQKRKADEVEDNGTSGEADNIDNNLIDQLLSNAKKFKQDSPNLAANIDERSSSNVNEVEEEFAEDLKQFTPRVAIHELETKSSCVHEVVIPTDLEYIPLRDLTESPNYKPAKEYKFVLDPFQKEAILCIENNQSVLGNILLILLVHFNSIKICL